MHRGNKPWTKKEEGYLACPIPARYLAYGALHGRTATAIRYRRRLIGVTTPIKFSSIFAKLVRNFDGGRRKHRVEDFPGADWSLPLKQLQELIGIGERATHRLRAEAKEKQLGGNKPLREGRRGYKHTDFPGVDWNDTTVNIMKAVGLSRPVVYRLTREAGVDTYAKQVKSREERTGRGIYT